MKDGTGAGEQAEVSRQELYEDYVNCYLQQCADVRPGPDARLLNRAAQYLLREPDPKGTFTVFPFYQAVSEDCEPLRTDSRKHLSAFIKATELLETLCINLYLQPWKKEFKTLKTFTGPFVYCLLPVLSGSTIESVLASIGYLPHADAPQSEFRLSEDANPDRAMLVGFELLLARVECYHLLELLEKDELEPQEMLDILRRRVGATTELEEPTEKKTTTTGQNEEEKKKEEADKKEAPLYSDTRLTVNPQPKPQLHHHLHISADQSIMEMQRIYPDLAFRGRLLVTDKPRPANGSRGSVTALHAASDSYGDDSKAAELHRRDCTKGTKAASTATCSKNDESKAAEVSGDSGRSSLCHDRNTGTSTVPGNTTGGSFSNTDRRRVDDDDDELSGPQGMSLHLTLRAGSKAEQDLMPGESQPTAAHRQQQAASDVQNRKPTRLLLPSLSSVDEEQELRQLAETMGQLQVQENEGEVKREAERKRAEENTSKERRKKKRKASTEGEEEELSLRKPVMETGPPPSHDGSRCTKSSQPDPDPVCHPSALTADCQSCNRGGGGDEDTQDTERAETGRGEEEQLAQSFVIVEHHKK
ncbi:uncharacterized protein LOC121190118 [Toxotes jaculatrix]|uniref:uncharacterized protein LOC121190118 n=1 Tax=Toxotes jaculatrix TaxID=941984 RepID=UPI001B3AD07A|nr:uncharacterized protein LOC121190118 [Toxotes jaculatrix]